MEQFLFSTSVEELSVVEMLGMIGCHKVSGTLTTIFGNTVKKIYIQDGKIAAATSSLKEDQFEYFLVTLGKLDPAKHGAFIKGIQTEGAKYFSILIKEKIITAQELVWLLRYQTMAIVYSQLKLKTGKIEFVFGLPDDSAILKLNLKIADLILDTARNFLEDTQIAEILEGLDRIIVKTDFGKNTNSDLSLTIGENMLLNLVDGNRTIRSVCELSLLGEYESIKLLAAFSLLRLIETKKVD